MYNSQLTTFVCVADCGSFTKAAEKLFISATAVMKQINALEEHLNLTLLTRTNRGIYLTAAGESIYKEANFLFHYSQKVIEHARQLTETSENTLCVGTSMLNPCKSFMDLWHQINKDFTGYHLHIVPFEDNHTGILSEINALGKKYDFLVAACDSTQWLNRCNFYPLGEYQRCCAVPMTHRLASKARLKLTDLYGETLMMVKRGDSPSNDCVRNDIERDHPQIAIEDTPSFYDIEVFNRCAQTNSVLSTLECWNDIHPSLVTIPIDWGYTIPYGLLYSLEPSENALRVIDAIKALRR